ncbi:MAG: hypothetical protein ABJO67_03215 [Pseudoruegeria sp.]
MRTPLDDRSKLKTVMEFLCEGAGWSINARSCYDMLKRARELEAISAGDMERLFSLFMALQPQA